jgi:hypothetical protein
LGGCVLGPTLKPANQRPFNFASDTFAFANELKWEYSIDPVTGETVTVPNDPAPEYTQHCFVVSRTVRQFFQFARFDASRPRVSDERYRELVRRVISRNPRDTSGDADRVVIPGYANLRSFSAVKETILKEESGSAALSYIQIGNWRMVFPFSRGHQEETARVLLGEIQSYRPPVVHLVRFPKITINHAVVLFDAAETEREIVFQTYDPNYPDKPVVLTYDRQSRSFNFPANSYFAGGPINVYEIYRPGLY